MATLTELWEELDRGRFFECSLRSEAKDEVIDGIQEGEDVYIDPRKAILEILFHEMLHRRHRRWGERKVRQEAWKLIKSMDEPAIRKWWVAYKRVVRRSVPVDV